MFRRVREGTGTCELVDFDCCDYFFSSWLSGFFFQFRFSKNGQ
jgi:hypothetical protein